MKKALILSILTISLTAVNSFAEGYEMSDFTKTPKAPISKWLINKVIKEADLDKESCKPEHFESAIKGNIRLIYTVEDACDGGNSQGIAIDISTFKTTHIMYDSNDIVEVK